MITTLYAALLAIFYVGLSLYVVKGRYQYRVVLGDGNVPDMAARIRSHANFAEYVPFALLLLFFVDDGGAMPWLVHVLGLMLLLGRIFHVFALNRPTLIPYARQMGMVLTFLMILICALLLLWKYIVLRFMAI